MTVMEACDDENKQYPTTQACLDLCAVMDPGEMGDQVGNSAACREHYAVEASEAPAQHCLSAGPTGNSICGSPCETFCAFQAEICTGANTQYATIQECLSECAMFPNDVEFSASVTTGDSLACRTYHLTVGASNPEVHCSHIVLDSPVCL